ncbi:hypothetical protein GCM10020001_022970 [Nonomuraea salmonea]
MSTIGPMSWGTPYTWLLKVVWAQMFGSTFALTDATSAVMSLTAPATTSAGTPRYSICTTSGVSPAWSAASSLAAVSDVPPTSESLTVTLGLSSWYLSTIACAPGSLPLRLQVQNCSVIGPSALAAVPEDSGSFEPHAASDAVRAATSAAAPRSVLRLRREGRECGVMAVSSDRCSPAGGPGLAWGF